jgi:hypothetical protein
VGYFRPYCKYGLSQKATGKLLDAHSGTDRADPCGFRPIDKRVPITNSWRVVRLALRHPSYQTRTLPRGPASFWRTRTVHTSGSIALIDQKVGTEHMSPAEGPHPSVLAAFRRDDDPFFCRRIPANHRHQPASIASIMLAGCASQSRADLTPSRSVPVISGSACGSLPSRKCTVSPCGSP